MSRGNGVVVDDILAVDQWTNVAKSVKFFFLSHCHADHLVGLTSNWSRGQIYTSKVTLTLLCQRISINSNQLFQTNAKLLKRFRKVSESFIHELELEEEYVLAKGADGSVILSVTLIDANHVPGSVMFLFKGCLGTILVTGDFRFRPDMFKTSESLNKARDEVDRLYLDNTFLYKRCDFPSREVVLDKVVQFLEQLEGHRVYVGVKNLGKEEAIVDLATRLNEKICVSRDKMDLFKLLNLPDVFTTDPSETRICLTNHYSLTKSYLEQANEVEPSVGVLLTALFHNWDHGPYSSSHRYGLHVFEYSDHSSFEELLSFVAKLRPKKVIPLVLDSGSGFLKSREDGFFQSRQDMSIFRALLSTKPKHATNPSLLFIHEKRSLQRTTSKRLGQPVSVPRLLKRSRPFEYVTDSERSKGDELDEAVKHASNGLSRLLSKDWSDQNICDVINTANNILKTYLNKVDSVQRQKL